MAKAFTAVSWLSKEPPAIVEGPKTLMDQNLTMNAGSVVSSVIGRIAVPALPVDTEEEDPTLTAAALAREAAAIKRSPRGITVNVIVTARRTGREVAQVQSLAEEEAAVPAGVRERNQEETLREAKKRRDAAEETNTKVG
jgi:hypothetical protein